MRGDVYRLRPAKQARGHEQSGVRYPIELRGPIAVSTVIVAPTSTRAAPAVFRPEIDMGRTTTKVLVDQLAAVDGALRLVDMKCGDMVGRLAAHEMAEVDLSLRLLLGLL